MELGTREVTAREQRVQKRWASKYTAYLTYNGGSKVARFPVNPEKLTVREGSKHRSMDIVGLGELVIPQARPAITIDFSSFFPVAQFQGTRTKKLQSPMMLVSRIKKWKNTRKPCQFFVSGTRIAMFCYIEKFDYYEDGNDVPGTLHFDISLVEYRDVSVRKIELDQFGNVMNPAQEYDRIGGKPVVPRTYKIQAGDTLYKIAKKFLGRGDKYMDILRINQDVLKNPLLIKPGKVIKLPETYESTG